MSIKKRIYYHHTDCGGVVYYGNYLSFLEEARTDFLEEKGVLVKDLAAQGTLFVVARQEIDYKFPSFYGDVLEIVTRVSETSGVRINLEYDLINQNKQLVSKAKTILVCVDSSLKPKPIPEQIRQKISCSK